MHERDIRKDLEDCFQQQQPCFRLFLEIIMLLDKVIDLYRPMANSGESQSLGWEFPAFEDVVMKCGGSQIGTSALGKPILTRLRCNAVEGPIIDMEQLPLRFSIMLSLYCHLDHGHGQIRSDHPHHTFAKHSQPPFSAQQYGVNFKIN
jgi:hypothetical protein